MTVLHSMGSELYHRCDVVERHASTMPARLCYLTKS